MPNNIVSITMDDMMALLTLKNMFGQALLTPNFDRLTAMGVTFENAFAQVALCNPSRTSALTGTTPGTTGVHSNTEEWSTAIDPRQTLPALLAASGFATSVIGKVFHSPSATMANLSGFENVHLFSDTTAWHVPSAGLALGPLLIPETSHGDYINTSDAVSIIQGWAQGSQNALFLGLFKPHADWVVPQQYYDLYDINAINFPLHPADDASDLPQYVRDLLQTTFHNMVVNNGQWAEALRAYFACISFADAQLGRVLDAIETSGHLSDTSIIVWSDNGYHLGDKGTWGKFTLWDEAARVNFVMYDPQHANNGSVVSTPVELLDFAPTVLDLLGMTSPWTMPGHSLVPLADGSAADSGGVAITTMYGSASIRTDSYRYIHYEDGSQELYAVTTDPNETVNLALDPAYASIMQGLWGQLSGDLESDGWVFAQGATDLSATTTDHHIVVQGGNYAIRGGTGNDTYFVTTGSPTVIEQANGGIDTVYASSSYTLPANVENLQQRTNTPGGRITLSGNALDNHISGRWHINGGGGNDVLELLGAGVARGGDGNDTVNGSTASDKLYGGAGNDTVSGSLGNDFIYGEGGDDILYGDAGADILRPGSGTNQVFGDAGIDTLDLSDLAASISVNWRTGKAVSLDGTTTFRGIETIVGGYGGMTATGNDFDNTLRYLGGNVTFDAGAGMDKVALPVSQSALTNVVRLGPTTFLLTYLQNGSEQTLRITDVERLFFAGSNVAVTPESLLPLFIQARADLDGVAGDDILLQDHASGALSTLNHLSGIVSAGTAPVGSVVTIGNFNDTGPFEYLARFGDGSYRAISGTGTVVFNYGIRVLSTLVTTADVNGDGAPDLIFRRGSDGLLFTVDGKAGGTRIHGTFANDTVIAVGDVTGDGRADIILRGSDNVMKVVDTSTNGVTSLGDRTGQDFRALGDFNGDGAADLLLRNSSTGELFAVDCATGTTLRSFGLRPYATVEAVKNLDGDAAAEILIRQGNGAFHVIDGSSGALTTLSAATGMEFIASADFDGDGDADLLFRDAVNQLGLAIDSAGIQLGSFALPSSTAIVGVIDLDADAITEILLRGSDNHLWAREAVSGLAVDLGIHPEDVLTLHDSLDGLLPPLLG